MTIEESTAPSIVKTKIEFEGMNESHAYFKFGTGRQKERKRLEEDLTPILVTIHFFRLMGSMMDGMLEVFLKVD